ncbi:MAG: hypothetical protein MR025_05210 [Helicobacter trogontum]|uniref:hypothetical protein n=1 Tax=Helicobacter trogontum TaxID=50960 RepID=UPI001319DD3D|nr:hypothetical protein [Helicobacter trogontum]MCI5786830.1 hypothetical protein [Helicobacter trogontum]
MYVGVDYATESQGHRNKQDTINGCLVMIENEEGCKIPYKNGRQNGIIEQGLQCHEDL